VDEVWKTCPHFIELQRALAGVLPMKTRSLEFAEIQFPHLHTAGVTGSIPVPPTNKYVGNQGLSGNAKSFFLGGVEKVWKSSRTRHVRSGAEAMPLGCGTVLASFGD